MVFRNLKKIARDENKEYNYMIVLRYEVKYQNGQKETQYRSSKVYNTKDNHSREIELYNPYDAGFDSGVAIKKQQLFNGFKMVYW